MTRPAKINRAPSVIMTGLGGMGGVSVPPPAPGSIDLDDLGDVDTSGVADGDTLVYDAGTSTWLVGAPASGGMVPYYIAPGDTFTVPLYKQALFTELIDNAGTLDVVGLLLEVD